MEANDVKAKIYNLSGQILLGKAKKEEIEEVVELSKKYKLLPLLREEFGSIGDILDRDKMTEINILRLAAIAEAKKGA